MIGGRRWAAAAAVLFVLAAGGAGVRYAERRAAPHPMASRANAGAAPAAPADTGSTVPSLVGQTLAAASQAAGAAQLRVVVADSRQDANAAAGTVLWQDPPAGGRLSKGGSLRVVVSRGTGIVPDLQGLPLPAATSRLQAAGLRLGRTTDSYGLAPDTAGKILSQVQPPGTRLTPGEAVDVIVSRGPCRPLRRARARPFPRSPRRNPGSRRRLRPRSRRRRLLSPPTRDRRASRSRPVAPSGILQDHRTVTTT